MLKRALLIALAVFLTVVVILPAFAQGNLLIDPGFEGTYTNRGRADFNVPEPWGVWYADSPRTEMWMNLQPVAFPHNGPSPNPYEGTKSFNFNKGYATYTAALYQQVPVTPGQNLSGSATAWLHTCNVGAGLTDCGSAVESGAFTRVGIDPNGGTNPYDSDVVWSANAFPHDRWETMTVNATATGPTATIFLYTTQQWPAQLNASYWDAAYLGVGGAGGAAAGQPVATAVPTAPPLAQFVTAQPPQPDGSIIHTVQPGDTMDAIAFAYGVSRADILALNDMSNGRYLLVGQQLLIREASSEATEEAENAVAQPTVDPVIAANMAATASAFQSSATATPIAALNPLSSMRIRPDGSVVWTVQEGQTADLIATTNGITVAELLERNDLASADDIAPGQELIIFPAPGAETAPSDVGQAEATPQAAPTVSGLTPETAPPAPIVSITSVLPAIDVADATAQVCVMMFNDLNQNRLQEVGEPMLGGGAIMLIKDDVLYDDYTTTGEDQPHCFDDLPDGDYLVSAFSPENFGLTTPTQLLVRPARGWTINIAFGAAEGFSSAVAPLDVPEPAATVASPAGKVSASSVSRSALTDNLSYVAFGLAGVVTAVGAGVTLFLRGR